MIHSKHSRKKSLMYSCVLLNSLRMVMATDPKRRKGMKRLPHKTPVMRSKSISAQCISEHEEVEEWEGQQHEDDGEGECMKPCGMNSSNA